MQREDQNSSSTSSDKYHPRMELVHKNSTFKTGSHESGHDYYCATKTQMIFNTHTITV